MNEEEKRLLKETAELTKKNHKILKSIQQKARFATIFAFIKWIIILGFAVWSYYLLEPFIEQTKALIVQVQQTTNTVSELKDKADEAFDIKNSGIGVSGLQNLLDTFKINGQ